MPRWFVRSLTACFFVFFLIVTSLSIGAPPTGQARQAQSKRKAARKAVLPPAYPSARPSAPPSPHPSASPEVADQIEVATLIPAPSPEPRVEGLEWNLEPMEVHSSPVPGQASARWVLVRGIFRKPDWTFASNKNLIVSTGNPAKEGEFSTRVSLQSYATPLEVFAVGTSGEVQRERAYILVKSLEDWWPTGPPGSRRRHHLFAGLMTSVEKYSETGRADYLSLVSSARLSYRFLLKPGKLELASDLVLTILPWFEVPSHPDARAVSGNARVSWRLPWIGDPWRLHLQGGWHFKSMFVSRYAYGYASWAGPVVFPVFERRRIDGSVHAIGARFVPVYGLGEILSLSNREIALSYAWGITPADGNPVGIGVDLSDLQLVFSNEASRVVIRAQSLAFTLSYGF